MSKFSTLGTHNIVEKRDTNIHEIYCHLLLHYKQKPPATIFSAFHSRHLNSDENVYNWQQWLQARVFKHSGWCTGADRRETELNPKLFIRVGIYFRKGILPGELLHGSGPITDFFKIIKSLQLIPSSTSIASCKGKQKLVILMVAITAYI